MPDDRPEFNRVFGVPIRPVRRIRPAASRPDGPEQQRVLGFPVDWFSSVDLTWLRPLGYPFRAVRRRAGRRRGRGR